TIGPVHQHQSRAVISLQNVLVVHAGDGQVHQLPEAQLLDPEAASLLQIADAGAEGAEVGVYSGGIGHHLDQVVVQVAAEGHGDAQARVGHGRQGEAPAGGNEVCDEGVDIPHIEHQLAWIAVEVATQAIGELHQHHMGAASVGGFQYRLISILPTA